MYLDFEGYGMIPARTIIALSNYINKGQMPGGFLTAVLENDLKNAVGRADCENLAVIGDIVKFLYNQAPSVCWGNVQKVTRWARVGGCDGLDNDPKASREFHSEA